MKTKPFLITRWIIATAIVSLLIACWFHFQVDPYALAKMHSMSSIAFIQHQEQDHQNTLLVNFIHVFIFGAFYIGAIALIVWLLGFLVPRKSENVAPEIPR